MAVSKSAKGATAPRTQLGTVLLLLRPHRVQLCTRLLLPCWHPVYCSTGASTGSTGWPPYKFAQKPSPRCRLKGWMWEPAGRQPLLATRLANRRQLTIGCRRLTASHRPLTPIVSQAVLHEEQKRNTSIPKGGHMRALFCCFCRKSVLLVVQSLATTVQSTGNDFGCSFFFFFATSSGKQTLWGVAGSHVRSAVQGVRAVSSSHAVRVCARQHMQPTSVQEGVLSFCDTIIENENLRYLRLSAAPCPSCLHPLT